MQEEFVMLDGLKIRYSTNKESVSVSNRPIVVLFHGNAFSLDNWEETKTMESLTKADFTAYAIDLPAGKGSKSDKVENGRFHDYKGLVPIIERIFARLGIDLRDLVLVGPSMGGGFASSYSLAHQKNVQAMVLIAPALEDPEELSNLEIPVLLLWGERDTLFPVDEYGKKLKDVLPRSRLVIIKGAGHALYLEKPNEFNEILLDFLNEII